MLFKLALLGATGYFGYRYFTRETQANHAAFADGQANGNHTDVRDAGPGFMSDTGQKDWSDTDQRVDESFPASDPPGNY